jgi:hypothetical protein
MLSDGQARTNPEIQWRGADFLGFHIRLSNRISKHQSLQLDLTHIYADLVRVFERRRFCVTASQNVCEQIEDLFLVERV